MSSIITLLTDFSHKDGYVGIMKGVILGINPGVRIVDLAHDISPQAVSEAAFVLKTSYSYFPANSIHVVVVDPGVGSNRKILCLATPEHTFLAPDNGVLSYIYQDFPDAEIFEVRNQIYFREQISQTFHGRDIFAPVAAHLSLGTNPAELGPPAGRYKSDSRGTAIRTEEIISASVAHIDHFGNIITNIAVSDLHRNSFDFAKVKDRVIGIAVDSYSEGLPGAPFLIPGSSGFWEIAINGGHAAETFNCTAGDPVLITLKTD